jgi:hypothetical protein
MNTVAAASTTNTTAPRNAVATTATRIQEASGITAVEGVCCCVCGKTPCKWLDYGVAVVENMEEHWDFSTACQRRYVLEHSNGDKVLNKTVRLPFISFFLMKNLAVWDAVIRVKFLTVWKIR